MHLPAFVTRHRLWTALAFLVGLPMLLLGVWVFVALNFSYSSGERAGYLQKISKRGWLCKTWEGELQMNQAPGGAPQVFAFTTRSEDVANDLNRLNGQRVVVVYKQHKGLPSSCFGETEYFITAVRPLSSTP